MKIISLPDNFSGAFAPVIYEVKADSAAEITQIEVLSEDGSRTVGIRRFKGENSYKVNVSSYLCRRLNVTPIVTQISGLFVAPGRATVSLISVGEEIAQERIITAGALPAQEGRILSDAPRKKPLRRGETDEISIVASSDRDLSAIIRLQGEESETELEIERTDAASGIVSLVVDMEHLENTLGTQFMNEVREIDALFICGNQSVANVAYQVKPTGANMVRLCWVNPYGVIDYHTFSRPVAEKIYGAKSRIYGTEGYKVTGSEAETIVWLRSEYLPSDTMRWLSQIVTAPKVWIADREGYRQVDVVTDTVTVADELPGTLTLAIRPAVKTKFQKN